MKTRVGHLVFGIDDKNRGFYRDLLGFLGWRVIHDGEGMLGVSDGDGVSLWFGSYTKDVANDYDGPGLNHVAIATAAQGDVDEAAAYLSGKGVALLFETPRHRPEFSGDDSTYYQIMFETPDHILVEIVYTGPKE